MKLMVLDGNSIVNRAFYGIRPLTTRDGLYTNAVYGFVTTLQRLLEEERRYTDLYLLACPGRKSPGAEYRTGPVML